MSAIENPHIRRFLDLSTSHVSFDAGSWLDTEGRRNAQRHPYSDAKLVARHQVGWFMYAGHDDGYHDDLKPIIAYAMANGCDYVNFDCDAGVIDALPVFERE